MYKLSFKLLVRSVAHITKIVPPFLWFRGGLCYKHRRIRHGAGTVHSGRYIYYKLTKTNLTRSVHGSARIYRQVTSLVRNFIWYIKLFILIQFVRILIWSWFTIQKEWSEGMVSQQAKVSSFAVIFTIFGEGGFTNLFLKASQIQVERLETPILAWKNHNK